MTADPQWDGERRRVDERFLRDHLGDELAGSTYLIAGPPPMVEAMEKLLGELGVPDEQVLPDGFSGY